MEGNAMDTTEGINFRNVIMDDQNDEISDLDIPEDDEKLGELDSNASEFLGFSPPSSPHPTATHQNVEKLESELCMLNAKREECLQAMVNPVKAEFPSLEVEPMLSPKKEVMYSVVTCDASQVPENSADPSSNQNVPANLPGSHIIKETEDIEQKASVRYQLPYEKGWRREVNIKSTGTGVVYIHPLGLRLNNLQEVSEHLTAGLTLDDFSFVPQALNLRPEFEIIIKENKETPSLPPVRKSGRVPVPSSNYKIVERMEESRKRAATDLATPKREKLVLKLKQSRPSSSSANGTLGRSAWSSATNLHLHPSAPKGPLRKVSNESGELAPPAGDARVRRKSASLRKKTSNVGSATLVRRKEEAAWSPVKSSDEEPRRVCSIACPMAMGLIPSLQCCVCLCLYHPECAEVGRTGSSRQIHRYVCKSCRSKPEARKPGVQTEVPIQPTPSPAPPAPPLAQPVAQQIIVSLNRRRFIMVPNLSANAAAPAQGPTLPQQNAVLPLADLPTSEPTTSLKPEGAATRKSSTKKVVAGSMLNFMQNICSGYSALIHVFQYLTVRELLRAARVCRLWKAVAEHPSLWRFVRIKNSMVTDWAAFADTLNKRGTARLDLRKMLPPLDGGRWDRGYSHLAVVTCLEELQLNRVSVSVLRGLLQGTSSLRVCCADIEPDRNLDTSQGLDVFTSEHKLEELRLRVVATSSLACSLSSLALAPLAGTLRVLSLLSFTDWQTVDTSCIGALTLLTELEIGDCSTFPSSFAQVFQSLQKLERVRLEVGSTTCPMLEILGSLGSLPNLNQLELINFDAQPELEDALACLTNVRSLLIIPNFVTQGGTKISSVLKGIYRLHASLSVFVWVFTLEFLHVTELYLDKYSSSKKTTPSGSNVPILMPLPMPMDTSNNPVLWREAAERYGSAGPIAVVPMSELQAMLEVAMPNTKVQIFKLPAQATARQTLKELLRA